MDCFSQRKTPPERGRKSEVLLPLMGNQFTFGQPALSRPE